MQFIQSAVDMERSSRLSSEHRSELLMRRFRALARQHLGRDQNAVAKGDARARREFTECLEWLTNFVVKISRPEDGSENTQTEPRF